MEEVEIKFEREGREGIVAPGTYLIDAAKRFGIRFEAPCVLDEDVHFCPVVITSGGERLSPETKAEQKYFATNGRNGNQRLACQVKIERSGEVVVMTEEKEVKTDPAAEQSEKDANEKYRKEFAEMPLEKKIANLVQLETIAIGETVSFIINSPFHIADKVMDVMAEFGFRKEEQQKTAARPDEHKSASDGSSTQSKKKKTPKQKPAPSADQH